MPIKKKTTKAPANLENESHKRVATNNINNDRRKRRNLGLEKTVARKATLSKSRKGSTTASATLPQQAVTNSRPSTRLQVFVCGEGTSGELGLGPKNSTEVKAPRPNPYLSGIVNISTGGMHAAALTSDNKLLTWGVNDQGALGRDTKWDGGLKTMNVDQSDNSNSDSDDEGLNPRESTPNEVPANNFPPGTEFVQVAAADSATFALDTHGHVYGWGTFRDHNGVYGFTLNQNTGKIVKIQTSPLRIPGLERIVQIRAGSDFALALDNTGSIFAWGCGQQNELGHRLTERTQERCLLPTRVRLPRRIRITSIHAGTNHGFAIDSQGDTWSWGLNNFGQTGIDIGAGEESSAVAAQRVPSLRGRHMKSIAGGLHHSLGVTISGKYLVWGRLDGGQSGLNLSQLPTDDPSQVVLDSRNRPRILLKPTELAIPRATYVAAGTDHSLAVTDNGKVYSWGFNATYQCGQGDDEDVMEATVMNGKWIRDEKIVWAGAGGQYSMVASISKDQ